MTKRYCVEACGWALVLLMGCGETMPRDGQDGAVTRDGGSADASLTDGGQDAAPDGGPDGGPDAGPQPGFLGEYFEDYRELALTRTDPSIDFVWDEAPDPALSGDRFSVRWTGVLIPPTTGTYAFATQNDDGVRLWVDGARVIDDWRGHFPERHEGIVELTAGAPVAIRVDYFEIDLGAEARLFWTPPGESERLLDGDHVFMPPGPSGLRAPTPPFSNPVVPFDCPDPGILAVDAPMTTYYMVCTGGTFPIRRSYDLVRWHDTGAAVLPTGKPAWAANGHRNWAPELHRVGDRFIAYYTTVDGSDVLSIGAAWADDPLGPYTDLGGPLVVHSDGVIDANYFLDDDGRHYLFVKIDGNAHGRRTPVLVRELAPDGLSFVPGTEFVEVLANDSGTWEGGVAEATWTVKRDGYYYLFYSANVYDTRYRTGVARASSVTGPYSKFGPPILTNDGSWAGPGHGSVIRVGDEDWFFYHAWNAVTGEGRFGMLDRIRWEGGWPRIGDGTPTEGTQPWPGAVE